MEWLVRELQSKRPLVPPAMPLTDEVKEVPFRHTSAFIHTMYGQAKQACGYECLAYSELHQAQASSA